MTKPKSASANLQEAKRELTEIEKDLEKDKGEIQEIKAKLEPEKLTYYLFRNFYDESQREMVGEFDSLDKAKKYWSEEIVRTRFGMILNDPGGLVITTDKTGNTLPLKSHLKL